MGATQSHHVGYRGNDEHRFAGRSSDEIKREVDETRSEMDQTIDELIARLDPGTLLSQAVQRLWDGSKSQTRHRGQQASQALSDAAGTLMCKMRENPIPAALIAVGAAWLLTSSDEDQDQEESWPGPGHIQSLSDSSSSGMMRDTVETLRHGASSIGSATSSTARNVAGAAQSAASNVAGAAQSAASTIREGLESATSTAKDTAYHAAARVRTGSSRAMRSAHRGTRMTRESYDAAMQDYPLAVGGAALALGFLCGLALPETQLEHEYLGSQRDQLLEKGKEAAQDLMERGQQVAKATANVVGEKLQEEGLGAESIADKVKRVASQTKEAVQQQVSQTGSTSESASLPSSTSAQSSQLGSTAEEVASRTEQAGDPHVPTGGEAGRGPRRTPK